jgi:UDP-2-acetamido-2-deoxy-ribo-hexuluronate aminotransferase
MKPIQMVDLTSQYQRLKPEIDHAISDVLNSASYINGPAVKQFSKNLEAYLDVKHVIPCANGTDALQIALMALDLPEGSEVITPGFSYIALAEVCCLLKLKPVYVDVDKDTFNMDVNQIEALITKNTKVIAPVHLYGQCADMESIMKIAQKHGLFVIEDNAQSIGADYVFSDGKVMKSGTIGDIGTTSFFPSKNLGCYGDGGAIYTQQRCTWRETKDDSQSWSKVKYIHDVVGVNSRLDSVQAAVLNVKLNHLDAFNTERQEVAQAYDQAFANHKNLKPPFKSCKIFSCLSSIHASNLCCRYSKIQSSHARKRHSNYDLLSTTTL